ncbi:hypothetical protein [Amycolatopsis jejuensis]|uniref:hypothetical protein n=1 Tax=Amycolatopsis jejuensis TaxID=330084 RepID=UPI000526B152|nr:hypothetical protein [Amycolatopsis jejuensis]
MTILVLTPEGGPFVPGSIADPATHPGGTTTYPPGAADLSGQLGPSGSLGPATCRAIAAAPGGGLAVTTIGYLSRAQHDLARATGRTVVSSPLLAVPMLLAMLPPGRRILVVYAHLGLASADDIPGVPPERADDVIRVGLEGDGAFRRAVLDRSEDFDHAAVAAQIIAMLNVPDLGAVVLECGEMAAVAGRVRAATDVPVVDYRVLVDCFAAALGY